MFKNISNCSALIIFTCNVSFEKKEHIWTMSLDSWKKLFFIKIALSRRSHSLRDYSRINDIPSLCCLAPVENTKYSQVLPHLIFQRNGMHLPLDTTSETFEAEVFLPLRITWSCLLSYCPWRPTADSLDFHIADASPPQSDFRGLVFGWSGIFNRPLSSK